MRYRRLRIGGGTYFFTLVTRRRVPVFRDAWAMELLQSTIEKVRERHPFVVDAHVTLPDHLHTIWSLPEGDSDFSTRWMLIKSSFARAWSKRTGVRGSPWQSRFWEHLIDNDDDFSNHIEYIHYNPVQHGLVRAPNEWRWSSFQGFVRRGEYENDWGSDTVPNIGGIDSRSE